jgi:hypothetical protein
MSISFRRCIHFREDNSPGRAVEISIEIRRLCICIVLAI